MTPTPVPKQTNLELNVKSTALYTSNKEVNNEETAVVSAQTSDNTTAVKQVEIRANEPDLKGAVDAQILAEKLEIVANQKAEADKKIEEENARQIEIENEAEKEAERVRLEQEKQDWERI